MIKISVIIPIHNTADFLEECVRSVLNQSLREIEVICVDDGSTDNSPAILERLRQDDDRIRLFRQDNAGQSIARNKALDEAQGEYIAFLDSDDYYAAYALERLYREAKASDLDELFFAGDSFFESDELSEDHEKFRTLYHYKHDYPNESDGQALFVSLRAELDYKPPIVLQLIKRSFIETNKLRFYPGILHEDNLFTTHCIMLAERAKVLNESLYFRRVRENSVMTGAKTWRHAYGYLVCIRETEKTAAALKIQDRAFLDALAKYQIQRARAVGEALQDLNEEELAERLATLPAEEHLGWKLLIEYVQKTKQYTERDLRRKKTISNLREIKDSTEERLAVAEKEADRLRGLYADLQQTVSYRLGRALTAPFRRIRRKKA